MKWGIAIVALIIAGALYYFWQQSHFESKQEANTQIQAGAKVEAQKQPVKEIPSGTIMEDGTI